MKTRIKIQAFFVFLAVTLAVFLPKFLFPRWQERTLDGILDVLGIVLILFGFLFRISARGYKSEKSNEGSRLITDGPYALMRNPMYFGTLMIGTGIIMVIFEWWTIFIFGLVFLLIYVPQVNKEQRELSIRFTDEYRKYCERLPRYFPKLSYLLKMDIRDYLFLKWGWIKKELPSLASVICAVIALEVWEDIRVFGYKDFFKEVLELSLTVISFIIISILVYRKKNGSKSF